MKRIAIVQDISCAGRCSTALALPVLSAMGAECVLLPTQLLSTHTGFAHPVRLDLSGFALDTLRHWKQQNLSLDAILFGYLGSFEALRVANMAMELFPQARVFLDPVMADHGKLYTGIDPAFPQAISSLLPMAEVVLPNLTEAQLLTGLDTDDPAVLVRALENMGCRQVLLTGISTRPGSIGFYCTGKGLYQAPTVERFSHGTGDLFASVTAGAMLQGQSAFDAGVKAARFVAKALEATLEITPYGVHFEKVLPCLEEEI